MVWDGECEFCRLCADRFKSAGADTVDFITYNKNNSGEKEYGFNSTSTVIQKVAEIKKLNLPGVMFWRLAGDLPINHDKSLLKAMSKEFYN